MKKIGLYFLAILFLFLAACSAEKEEPIISTSPDGVNKIIVEATKESLSAPWNVKLILKPKNLEEQFVIFELMAAGVTKDNVVFDWKDSNNGTVTFEHSDGAKRVFKFFIADNRAQLQELGQ